MFSTRFSICLWPGNFPNRSVDFRCVIGPSAIAFGSSAIVKVSGQNCFRTLYASPGQGRLGPPEGSAKGSTKVPARVHQGSTKALQVSWCLWLSGAPSWAAKRFRGKFPEVSPRFHQQSCASFVVSLIFWAARLGLPKRSEKGSTKVKFWLCGAGPSWAAKRFVLKGSVGGSPRFRQGFTEVPPRFQGCASFLISLAFWGRSLLGCQKILWKVTQSLL